MHCVACENPSVDLVVLTTFLVKVYSPMLIQIKTKSLVIYSAQHSHQSIVLSRYMSKDLKEIIDHITKGSGVFVFPKNVLISMLVTADPI